MDKFVNTNQQGSIDTKALDKLEQESIFREISSIIASTYFSAVDTMFRLKSNCSVPEVSLGDEGLAEFIDKILCQKQGIS